VDKVTTLNTAELLAKEHGVSEKTIRRDGKRAEELDRLAANYPQASMVGTFNDRDSIR
jgi:DeoR/GlpR family transcriptional regulator of sugar metabolism